MFLRRGDVAALRLLPPKETLSGERETLPETGISGGPPESKTKGLTTVANHTTTALATSQVINTTKLPAYTKAQYIALLGDGVTRTRSSIAKYLRGGLDSVADSATLIYQARKLGAKRDDLAYIVLGNSKPGESDGGAAKVYRAAMRLATFWNLKGNLPPDMATANSFEAASNAAMAWLEGESITSVEKLNNYLTTGLAKPDKVGKAVNLRFRDAVTRSIMENEINTITAAAVAKDMLTAMVAQPKIGLENVKAFRDAVDAAYQSFAKAAIDAAANAANVVTAMSA